MLVLTRKLQESIMIGDDIEIVVSSIERKSVRIGIKAPKDVKILRRETYDEVRSENLRAIEAAAKYTEGINEILSSDAAGKKQALLKEREKQTKSE